MSDLQKKRSATLPGKPTQVNESTMPNLPQLAALLGANMAGFVCIAG